MRDNERIDLYYKFGVLDYKSEVVLKDQGGNGPNINTWVQRFKNSYFKLFSKNNQGLLKSRGIQRY